VVKKRVHPPSQSTSQHQLSLDVFERQALLHSLNHNQILIIQHLQSGYYPAMISRKVKLSRSYISRFIHKLLDAKLISTGYKDPLFRRAIVYEVSKELANYIANLTRKDEEALTLVTPHNMRFKRRILKHDGKNIGLDLNRFAHAKWRHIRTYTPKGGDRYVFEMQGTHGRYRAIVHPTASIEMLCIDRNYIPAKGIPEADQILSMSLQGAYTRFTDEQNWLGCRLELGEPETVGSIHYAFKSKDLKKMVKTGKTQITDTMGIDCSPANVGDTTHVELETPIRDEAIRFDENLRMVPTIRSELRSVQDTILNINTTIEQKITGMSSNIEALCQSGLPLNNQFSQMTLIVARQGESIHLMQTTMLSVVESMSKILSKMNIE
jgi:DNA-binding MarR family transcriptional regulator